MISKVGYLIFSEKKTKKNPQKTVDFLIIKYFS